MSSPRVEASAALVGAAPPVYTRGEAGPFCSAHGLGWDVAVTSLPCSVLPQPESSSLLRSHLLSCHCRNPRLLWIRLLHWQKEVCTSQTWEFHGPSDSQHCHQQHFCFLLHTACQQPGGQFRATDVAVGSEQDLQQRVSLSPFSLHLRDHLS